MKKGKIVFIVFLVVLIIVAGYLIFTKQAKKENNNSINENTNTIVKDDNEESKNMTTEEKVNEKINNMTLEEKIGQMIMVSYRNPEMDDILKNMLETIKPGGFILFSENLKSKEQTDTLIKNIKSTAKIPMLISIDQEGGRVQRLKELEGVDITIIPAMSEIGVSDDENLAYDTGKTIAKELNMFGINMDFAPVIDIYSNPQNTVIGDRSFGSNATLVSKMGIALAKGLSDNNVIPVYKHFPGHGNTETDSHYDLPVVTKSKKELLESDVIPFKNAIDSGAKIIMVGHLAVPSITNGNIPASLSKELITNFLKNELGYKNIVTTDALDMKAITNNYTDKQVYELAINAGVDILLMPNDSVMAISLIKESINEGTISEEQINNSVRKILMLKYESGVIND